MEMFIYQYIYQLLFFFSVCLVLILGFAKSSPEARVNVRLDYLLLLKQPKKWVFIRYITIPDNTVAEIHACLETSFVQCTS